MSNSRDTSVQKEFVFTDSDFRKIVGLIHKVAGIALATSKKEMVYSRIARRLRATNFKTFDSYLNWLEKNPGHGEWQEFINALTTNLTSFFREEHHFPILADFAKKQGNDLNIWCSAASTGEEPYSIAITLCEAFNTLNPPAKIIATDIDTHVLQTARAGVYQDNRIEKLNNEMLSRYFLKGKGERQGMVKVRQELAKLITYQQLNLLEDSWNLSGSFDVIFCRNVMIYFDKPTQSKILQKFETLLKPGGLLFAGHSENFSYVSNAFKLEGKTVYRRLTAGASK